MIAAEKQLTLWYVKSRSVKFLNTLFEKTYLVCINSEFAANTDGIKRLISSIY